VTGPNDSEIAQHVVERGHYPGKSVAEIQAKIGQIRATGQPYTAPNGNVLYRLGPDILIDDMVSEGGSMFRPDNVSRFIQEWLRQNP
jgi:hypothetical protein